MNLLPWYSKYERMFAQSESLLNLVLIGIIFATLMILLFANVWVKAGWAVYLLSP